MLRNIPNKKSVLTARGFTSTEHLFVIIVIGILLAVTFVALSSVREKSRRHSFKSEVSALRDPLVLMCENRPIIKAIDFPENGNDTNNVAWSGALIARNNCGPQGANTFRITNISPRVTMSGCSNVTLDQSGADFTNCP